MSQLEVDKIIPQSGTTLTIGDSGDTVNFADGTNLSIDTNTLYIDSTNNRVGIANASPSVALDVTGDAKVSGDLTVDTSTLYVDSTNNKVGIGTAFPNNYASSANTLVVGSTSGQNGITIVTSTSETGSLQFADGATGNQSYQGRIRYDHSASTMSFHVNNGSERMRIDSSGNLLLNTSSAKGDDAGTFAPVLTVNGGSYDGLVEVAGNRSDANGAGVGRLQFIQNSNSANYKEVAEIRAETEGATANQRGGRINFRTRANGSTSTTEHVRIDSSGNLLVGKTSTSNTTAGVRLGNSGVVAPSRSADAPIVASRLSTDGTIIELRKDGTEVGAIGIQSSGFYIDGESGHEGIRFANGTVTPRENGSDSDNASDLGATTNRWKDIYLGGGLFIGGTGTANKLDDYEEGNWTPIFQGSTPGSYTYVEQQGHYVKIGSQVTAWFNLTNITTSTAGSGIIFITGLPFASNVQSGFNNSGVSGVIDLNEFNSVGDKQVLAVIPDNASYILLYKIGGTPTSTSAINVTDKNSNNSDLRGFVTYYTGG